MSSGMPPMMQDLFAAARDDAPSSVTRDVVWGKVAGATAVPAAVTTVAAVKVASSMAPAKLIAIGAAIGAAAIGALSLSLTSGQDDDGVLVHRAPSVVTTGPTAGARLADPTPRARAVQIPADNAFELPANVANAATEAPQENVDGNSIPDDGSALAEEARLVTEARAALLRGEPERALTLSRSTRKLKARVLEPEELRLEARALTALGRTDEAVATELTLRRRFPGQLAR